MADLSAGTDLCNTYHPYRQTDGSANADSGAKVQNLSRHTREGKHSGHMGNKVIHLDQYSPIHKQGSSRLLVSDTLE